MIAFLRIFFTVISAVAFIEMFLHQDELRAWEDEQIARFRAWFIRTKAELSARIIKIRLGVYLRLRRISEDNLSKKIQQNYNSRLAQIVLAYDARQAELRARKEAILKQ